DAFGDDDTAGAHADLRRRVAGALFEQADIITGDSVAIFPYSGSVELDVDYCHRIGRLLTQLLGFAVRDGQVDARGAFVGDLYRVALERSLSIERLFAFAYLTERTAVDELAVSESIGATSEAWPIVAKMVRRASFDLLAAYSERTQIEPAGNTMIDRLTTLYSRMIFDAVLAKEADRAGRLGQSFSLILFDVDRLASINQDFGYGVGDKVLERLGILLRTYFRQHDWVARHSEDAMIVLLTFTDADRATELAERVRHTVEARLWFTDHRTDREIRVTVSAAVVNVPVSSGDVIDPERLLAIAETAIERAKRQGRNRVEAVDGSPGIQVRLPSI
ncbi:MAG TPA: GGDEF domain-containing protein, partial [Vicinamibacterales bacterium]|nr:GGDEF domain-containing protein [Vicinamibacterales bacterium]